MYSRKKYMSLFYLSYIFQLFTYPLQKLSHRLHIWTVCLPNEVFYGTRGKNIEKMYHHKRYNEMVFPLDFDCFACHLKLKA